jgi:uncharacterized membrane protein YkoI
MMGAGAGALLLVGGLAAGPVASLAQGGGDADLSEDEAVAVAVAEFPGTSAVYTEFERDDGQAVYEIQLSNGYEVEVDGNSGKVLEQDAPDDDRNDHDDNDDGDRDEAGTIDDGASLLPEASISLDEAIAAARNAADGAVGDVDLEYAGDRLVFNVDVGNNDVRVDATDGSVVSVTQDD